MQNKRMEPKGYPKLYIGTARGDVRLSSQHKLKSTRNFECFHIYNLIVVNVSAPNLPVLSEFDVHKLVVFC